MRASALHSLLPFFVAVASAAPHLHDHHHAQAHHPRQLGNIEAGDDGDCEMTWVTVTGPERGVYHQNSLGSQMPQNTQTVAIPLASGSGGEAPSSLSAAGISISSPVSGAGNSAAATPFSSMTASAPGSSTSSSPSAPVPRSLTSASFPSTSASTEGSTSGKYPFNSMVVFGDNLSDNGNGSYAHHVCDHSNPNNNVYGSGTWTDGPVAVSYLTDLLGVPMTQNLAFGHAWGGSSSGATIDNTIWNSNFSDDSTPYFHSGEFSEDSWGAPSFELQVKDYIAGGVNKNALHHVWIGNNDINIATLSETPGSTNDKFNTEVSTKITALVSQLLTAGAPYVMVANLYPKHLAPITPHYYYMYDQADWDAFGAAINAANTALEAALQNVKGAIYYDAFTFMANLYANPGDNFPNEKDTNGWPAFIDGDSNKTSAVEAAIAAGTITEDDNWGLGVDAGLGGTFFWMQYLDMTSHTHQLVAEDMERFLGTVDWSTV